LEDPALSFLIVLCRQPDPLLHEPLRFVLHHIGIADEVEGGGCASELHSAE
jgi:hypothetical protein